ncbi:Acyltransferase [Pleurostoma richardsiae]|uniref:Acyltransferase n=1 Tax=Pleurostoma richardsiae TaxID=41990 RepID=A0AA38R7P8_9PEZI|nr:Acyltransferase [Pleurostoma richardsiae]
MNGFAPSKHPLIREQNMSLLDEKSLSDIDSDPERCGYDTGSSRAQKWMNSAGRIPAGFRISRFWSAGLRVGFFILPSFVQSRLSGEPKQQSKKPGPTAYLDGMRGLAAFFVFFCHYFYTCFVIAEGWGYGEHNYSFLKLPIVRLFYQGPPMVCVFFVISGYALSLRPLKLARARALDALASSMASLVFRRAVRLFVPTALSTLLVVVLLRLGAYEGTRGLARDPVFMRNVHEHHPERRASAAAQLAEWAHYMFDFVHVWDWRKFGGSTPLDVHLWTIPVEFRASMMLFLTLMGTARLRTCMRFVVLAGVTWFSYRSDRWEMVLFYAGMGLAELDLIRGAHTPSLSGALVPTLPTTSPDSSLTRRTAHAGSLVWPLLSVVALYLMSQPDAYGEQTPGWVYLSSLIPVWFSDKYRYWQSVGAILLVLAVGRSPGWQRVFTNAPALYLGRISYAVYLMHGPVLHTLGYAVERWAWGITGMEGGWYNMGFVLAALINVPAVIWAADLWWRAVDAPVVRFAKWLEASCSVPDGK